MKVKRLLALMFFLLVGFLFLSPYLKFQVKAEVPANVGVIDLTEVPDWVRGHEETVRQRFISAYNENNFTSNPDSTIVPLDLIRGTTDHKRYALVQQFDTEGILLLNDVKGKVLAVKDPVALAELNTLRNEADHDLAAQLLDVVESGGKTYYVTDRRNANGIFHIEAGEAVYLDKRIGIGTGTYADIMWFEYFKAYQASTNYNESLGLPLGPVASHRYHTVDLNNNGTYKLTNGNKTTSEKLYTKQQFENGWIIQARMQILTDPVAGTLGGHQESQHAAAPIKNDMYALVTGLADNSDLSLTGAPVSVEFLVDGIRYQNFEYGHVRVEEGIATFVLDWVVDSKATQVPRRIGMSRSWNNWRIDRPDNAGKLGLLYERLRVAQNFRELVGQMVRDGRAPYRTDVDPTGDVDIFHNGQAAPVAGIWFSFKGGEGEFLGAANSFIYQYDWYMPAFELAPALNTAQFVDAKDGIGRPNQEFVRFHNVQYQFFTGGFGYKNMSDNSAPVHIIGEVAFNNWLGSYQSVEEALIGKGIVIVPQNPNHEIGTFKSDLIPDWAKRYQEHIQTVVTNAYNNAGWNTLPDLHLIGVDLGKARVMAYQQFGNDGYIVVNDLEGKAFILTTEEFRSIQSYREIFLAKLESGHIVTDEKIYRLEGGVRVPYQYQIGVGPANAVDFSDVTLNEFTKAYKMAENYHPTGLGLPLEQVKRVSYNTFDLQSNGKYVDGKPRSIKYHTQQKFENGYIISARIRKEDPKDHIPVQHGAAPITNEMYNKVVALSGNETLNNTGAPVSIQFIHNGVTYQNFEYGYVKYGSNGVATFVADKVVDFQGTEMNRRIGAGENFNNWIGSGAQYTIVWERLRVGMNIRNAMGEMIRAGRQPYITTTDDPNGDERIHHVPHEYSGMGVVHIYLDGEGAKYGFGNSFIVQGYWYNPANELAPVFNALGSEKDSADIYYRDSLGRPSDKWQKIKDLTFQEFEKGFVYKYDNKDMVVLHGTSFNTWMGNRETVWESIVFHKLIKYDVVFKNTEGATVKTVIVAHGDNATGQQPTPSELNIPNGYEFIRWDLDITNVISDMTVLPVTNRVKYTVNFKTFSGDIIKSEEVDHGDDATPPADPERVGYTFNGWSASYTNITSNLDLTAQYSPISYTITYLPEGVSHSNPTTYTIETEDIALDSATPPPGYNFSHWKYHEGDPVTKINKGEYGNKTIVAVFSLINYEIKYHNLAVGDIHNNPLTYTVEDLSITLQNLSAIRSGHYFEGWYSDEGLTNKITVIPVGTIGEYNVYANILPNPHTITYMINGEIDGEIENYVYGQSITIRSDKVKSGYTFNWDKTLPATMPDEDIVINGIFTAIEYNITYNNVLENEHSNPSKYTIEQEVIFSDASKLGYTFNGWYDREIGGNLITKINLGSTQDKSVYARFSPIEFTISYDLDGGENDPNNPTNYTIETQEITFKPATKTGYKFLNWVEVEEDEEFDLPSIPPAAQDLRNIILRAKFEIEKYTITFNTDGGTEIAQITLNYNAPITPPDNPTKEGYFFSGWQPAIPSTMPEGGIIVTAQWIKLHQVVFVDHDGTILKSQEVEYGSAAIAPDSPTRVGYTFSGWDKEFNIVTEPLTVNAKYTINQYTITFNTDGGTEIDPITLNYNALITPPDNPVKEGYFFNGWEPVIPSNMPEGGISVTAQWIKLHKVVFIDHDGTILKSQDVKHGEDAVAPIDPTRVGHTFSGWDKSFDTVVEPLTITANYNINQYTITFNTNGGTEIAPITKDYNTAITAPNNPTKEGYLFTGWDKAIPSTMPAENMTINANWQIRSFTISFNTDGGNEIDSITQEYGSTINKPSDPEKEGYIFIKWEPAIPDTMPGNNLEVKAIWQIKVYEVKFVDYDNSQIGLTQEVKHGEGAVAPTDPTRVGYTFSDWDKPFSNVTQNLEVKALYIINQYKITFNTNGGNAIASITLDYDALIIPPVDPKKVGHTFVKWDPVIPSNMPAENITVNAIWDINSYTLTFESNGGSDVENITQEYNTELNLPTPQREGYNFRGWFIDDETFNNQFVATTMPAENKLLYAAWTEWAVITFNLDGGSSTVNSITQAPNTPITVPTPTKLGHTFKEWSPTLPELMPEEDMTIKAIWTVNKYSLTIQVYGQEDVVIEYSFNQEIDPVLDPSREGYQFTGWNIEIPTHMPANHVTIIAKWEINKYEVKFVDHDNSILKTETVNHGSSATAPESPTRVGYTFSGWDMEFNIVVEPLTITANYTVNQYTITFNTDGGTEIAPITKDYGTPIVKPADPLKEGHSFVKWNVAIPNTMPANNLTITAEWSVNSYTINFDSDGGTSVLPMTLEYGSSIPQVDVPEKTGYEFVGWNPEIPATMPEGGITIKALWQIKQYTITFDTDGGSEITSITKDYNAAITPPNNPEKQGHSFAGWDQEIPNRMPANNMLIKAIWTRNSYNLIIKIANLDDQIISYLFEEEIAPIDSPSREGYQFIGWNIEIPTHMPASNVTIVAEWEINKYEVKFVDHDDTILKTETVEHGSAATAPVEPQRVGYTFSGWDKVFNTVTEPLTVNANYTINQYTITFNTDGGTVIDPITKDYNAAIVAPDNPEKEGYSFVKWSIDIPTHMPASNLEIVAEWEIKSYNLTIKVEGKEDQVIIYEFNQEIDQILEPTRIGYQFKTWDQVIPIRMPAQDVTIEATWNLLTYHVTYFLDGGIEVDNATEFSIISEEIILKDTSKEGHKFIGWYPLPTAGDKVETIPSGSYGDMNLYARFEKENYTITYYLDDEVYGEVEIYPYDSLIVKRDNPVKEGHTFSGWSPTIPNKMPARNLEIRGQLIINKYEVKFIGFNETQILKEETVIHGNSAVAPTPPLVPGHTFDGWDQDFSEIKSNLEIKAIYQINKYQVKFIGYNNEQLGQIQTVVYNQSASAPEAPIVVGYTFTGWDQEFSQVQSNLEVKAIYEINKYEVKFLDKDGALIGDVKMIEHGSNATAPNPPEVIGYTFDKWNQEFDNITEHLTIKALYILNQYEVKFMGHNNQEIGETQLVSHNQSAIAPAPPIVVGYKFIKWDQEFSNVTNNLVVNAVYEVITFTVKFFDKDNKQIGEDQIVNYAFAAVAPEAPEVLNYTFQRWDKSFERVTSNLEIKAIYILNISQSETLKNFAELKKEVNRLLELNDSLEKLPSTNKYLEKQFLNPIKETIQIIEEKLGTGTLSDEDIIEIDNFLKATRITIENNAKKGGLQVVEDPEEPNKPSKPQINQTALIISIVGVVAIVGIAILVLKPKK